MQRFFDLLATKFYEAIERGFTMACDRMEARLQHVEQTADETPSLSNGRRKVLTNGKS